MTEFAAAVLVIATFLFVGYPLLKPLPESEDAIEQEVARLRRAKAGGKLACHRCGYNYVEGDRFCQSCGAKLGMAKGSEGGGELSKKVKRSGEKLTCGRCGASYNQGDRFCESCGSKLDRRSK